MRHGRRRRPRWGDGAGVHERPPGELLPQHRRRRRPRGRAQQGGDPRLHAGQLRRGPDGARVRLRRPASRRRPGHDLGALGDLGGRGLRRLRRPQRRGDDPRQRHARGAHHRGRAGHERGRRAQRRARGRCRDPPGRRDPRRARRTACVRRGRRQARARRGLRPPDHVHEPDLRQPLRPGGADDHVHIGGQ